MAAPHATGVAAILISRFGKPGKGGLELAPRHRPGPALQDRHPPRPAPARASTPTTPSAPARNTCARATPTTTASTVTAS
ncbi:hypothetical protein [Nonomuraea salmonea]|uniref:hypothetical protein n=1 Tax=Nonomuraea salmonea TaxID=46181 RepID=UPI0031E63F2C